MGTYDAFLSDASIPRRELIPACNHPRLTALRRSLRLISEGIVTRFRVSSLCSLLHRERTVDPLDSWSSRSCNLANHRGLPSRGISLSPCSLQLLAATAAPRSGLASFTIRESPDAGPCARSVSPSHLHARSSFILSRCLVLTSTSSILLPRSQPASHEFPDTNLGLRIWLADDSFVRGEPRVKDELFPRTKTDPPLRMYNTFGETTNEWFRRVKFSEQRGFARLVAGWNSTDCFRFILRLRLRRNLRGANCRHLASHSPRLLPRRSIMLASSTFLFFFFLRLKSHRHPLTDSFNPLTTAHFVTHRSYHTAVP